jgi:hypothetical protein
LNVVNFRKKKCFTFELNIRQVANICFIKMASRIGSLLTRSVAASTLRRVAPVAIPARFIHQEEKGTSPLIQTLL